MTAPLQGACRFAARDAVVRLVLPASLMRRRGKTFRLWSVLSRNGEKLAWLWCAYGAMSNFAKLQLHLASVRAWQSLQGVVLGITFRGRVFRGYIGAGRDVFVRCR